MKINKILKESKLVEANENIEDVVIDTNASTAEVADQVKDAVEVQTDDNATLSDAKADKVATEIKNTANEIGAGEAAILPPEKDVDSDDEYITENILTSTLDKALTNSRKFKRRRQKIDTNVLIVGLPGSGKTAIVTAWAKERGIRLVPINVKNNKLEVAIDGLPMRVNGTDKVSFLSVDLLDDLGKGECVMFIDEYNRQVNPQIRGALLTLINEKRTADGKKDFSDTLLFTVALMNPAVPTDPGAAKLNDAEKSRFPFIITDFDSDNDTALNYNDVSFANKLAEYGIDASPLVGDLKTKSGNKIKIKHKDLTEEEYNDVIEFIKVWDLTKYILSTLQFDTKNDLLDLSAGNTSKILNSRELVNMTNNAGGDKDMLLFNLDHINSLLDKDKQQFHDILDDYIIDIDYYLKKLGIDKDQDDNTEPDVADEADVKVDDAQVVPEEEDDDDDGLFMSGGSTNTISDAELRASLDGLFDGWSK